jgi:hypothetical protein
MLNYDSVFFVFGLNGRMGTSIQRLCRTPPRDSLTAECDEVLTDRRFRPQIVPRVPEIRRECDRLLQ